MKQKVTNEKVLGGRSETLRPVGLIKEFAKMIKWSVIMLLLLSCEKDNEEVFPVEPHIEFTNIVFNEPKVLLPSPDTLELSFSYTDGDADLGLDYDNPVHNAFPYHQFYYYLKTTGEKISSDKLETGEVLASQLIRLEDRAYPPNSPSFVTRVSEDSD